MLGDKFSGFTSLFKTDEATDGEDGKTDEGTVDDNVDNSEEGVDGEGGSATDTTVTNTDEGATDTTKTDTNGVILAEGWLLEDGNVDLEKILDESLKGYIEGLNKKIADIDQDMLKALIEGEAKSQGMVDITDILKFVDLSTTTKDNVGEVVSTLKKDKGYLFKQKPVNDGFNPSKQQVKAKYKEGMSFSDAMSMED